MPPRPATFGVTAAAGLLLLAACEQSDDGGECPPADPVAVVGVATTVHLRRTGAPNAERYAPLAVDETVSIDDYALGVTMALVRTTRVSDNAEARTADVPTALARHAGGLLRALIGDAHALSCAATASSTQTLADLAVRTDTASFNAASMANTSFIDATTEIRSGGGEPVVAQFFPVPADTVPLPSLADYLEGTPVAPLRFALVFDGELPTDRDVRFTIDYALADGQTFTIDTDPVRFGSSASD